MENGTKNVRNPHILRILANFLVFLDLDFFWASIEHSLSVTNISKQYPSHMKSQIFFKSSKKWKMDMVRRM